MRAKHGWWHVPLVLFGACGAPESRDTLVPDATVQNEAPSDMRLIPAGTFRMGTDSSEIPGILRLTGLSSAAPLEPEMPSHGVSVGAFFMDTVDVTNEDFARFVAADSSWGRLQADTATHNGRYLEHWTDDGPPAALLDHPVTFVSWYAAVAYCSWRGKRLPTEAEYEWAAQSGDGRPQYPWGDEPPNDTLVSWAGDGIDGTVPVGSYSANERGLYDMAGNVWRFTSDPWRGSYAEMMKDSASEVSDPRVRRVVRGGSWGANAANLRVRYRDSHRPFDAREMVGFRCARSVAASG